MRNFFFILSPILLVIHGVQITQADIFAECDGIPDETFVPSSESCSAYIYCVGDESMTGECNDGEYFDGEALACDLAANVYCPLDDEPETQPDPQPDPETDPEVEEPSSTVTTTPATTTTTTSATTSMMTTTFDPLHVPSVVRINCPATDDPNQIVLMANNQSCSEYYLCYHGHAIEMQCTNHLHFNAYTAKCDFPENVQCSIDRPNANKCLPHITDFFPHPEKCNYFYYCIKGFLTVQQCPFYYGWDVERRSCVQMSQAKCFHNAKKRNVPGL